MPFVQINVPAHVGGATVHTGDLIHGDRNGVTTIPIEIASAVALACPEFMAAESVILDYCKSGRVDAKGFASAQKECRDRIYSMARLHEQLYSSGELFDLDSILRRQT